MKVQLATFEALISLLIVVAAASYLYKISLNDSATVSAAALSLRSSAELSDLSALIELNSTYKTCVLSANSLCISGLLARAYEIYGMHAAVKCQGLNLGNASNHAVCLLIENRIVCVSAGG
ncbi:MAG: hypothetical protein ACP5TJ_00910 [Candidatus Micrarchaeia archaeon]